MRITDPEAAAFFRGLIFGPPGGGKTHLLGSAGEDERASPILILASDKGVTTLVGRPGVKVALMRDWKDYSEAFEELDNPDTPWKSFGVDSLSETQVGGLFNLLEQAPPEGRRPAPDVITQSEWGVIKVQMSRLVRRFLELPLHSFWTALETDDLDRVEGKVKTPFLQGSFAKDLPGIFDIVGYLGHDEEPDENGDEVQLLLLRNWPGYRVKARTPFGLTPPDALRNPTVTKILDELGYKESKKK